jgi:hypothetical protein
LLLLHEGLGCVALWRHFPDKLAAATGCRVVWSRAGYGGSEPYPEAPRAIAVLAPHKDQESIVLAALAEFVGSL